MWALPTLWSWQADLVFEPPVSSNAAGKSTSTSSRVLPAKHLRFASHVWLEVYFVYKRINSNSSKIHKYTHTLLTPLGVDQLEASFHVLPDGKPTWNQRRWNWSSKDLQKWAIVRAHAIRSPLSTAGWKKILCCNSPCILIGLAKCLEVEPIWNIPVNCRACRAAKFSDCENRCEGAPPLWTFDAGNLQWMWSGEGIQIEGALLTCLGWLTLSRLTVYTAKYS